MIIFFSPSLLAQTEVDGRVESPLQQDLQDPVLLLLLSLSTSKQTQPVSQMGFRGNTDWSLLDYTTNPSKCQTVKKKKKEAVMCRVEHTRAVI